MLPASVCGYFFCAVLSGLLAGSGAAQKNNFQKVPATIIWAVPGRDVELPCDVTPPVPDDAVSMVFWFKDTMGMPLYSLDARGGPLSESSHLANSDDLGSRSYFVTEEDNPSKMRLKIKRVAESDEGVFRCRVDFINSPTRNFQVNLTLVVQPSAPKVFDVEGKEVMTTAGPFLEGHKLFLSCQTNGGRPSPTLVWWHNGTEVDSVVDVRKNEYTVNQLEIPKVPRSLRGAKLECRATSMEVAGDIVKEVPIVVYLKPSKVKIVTPNELLSSGKVETVRCETSGSYPPAKITWSLDGKPIRNAVLTEEETETFSSSILSVRFEAEDDGKELICRATNPRFPGGHMEDRRRMHVAYPPKVEVRLDTGATSIVTEGSLVILRCEYWARPNPHSFNWYHNGHLVAYNETGGVLPMDATLTVGRIGRASEGEYSCSAANSEGETYSAPFNLVVQYAPRCRKGYGVQRVGALMHESMTVQCNVDALPEVTRFHWTYNTSKGVLPISGAKMQNRNGVSVLHFTPGADDIESLSCWATNSVGRQETPCHFLIVPADKPESPRNCILRNGTRGTLEISCIPGSDGGLQQKFVLEVEDITATPSVLGATTLADQGEHVTPLFRMNGDVPTFRLHSLKSGREYQFLVYATNARGRSSPPVLLSNVRIDTLEDPQEENGFPYGESAAGGELGAANLNLTLLLVILSLAAMALIVGIVTVATVLACRRRPPVTMRARTPTGRIRDDVELSEAGFNENFHRRSAQYRASLYNMEIDAEATRHKHHSGPDLILSPANFPQPSSEY